MNISGLLGISRSGLNHLQTNLDTTANNIANVNTNGYQAQTTHFQALMENAIVQKKRYLMATPPNMVRQWGKSDYDYQFCPRQSGGHHSAIRSRDPRQRGPGQTDQLLLSRAGNFSFK